MEKFKNHDEDQENEEPRIIKEDGDWCYEKKDGRWQLVRLPELNPFDKNTYEETHRRTQNFLKMMDETEEEWKLKDESVPHNEGILRNHPRYHDLFIKWAMTWLRRKGFDISKYSGKIDEDEGNLLRPDGRRSSVWLVNAVANGREWIDENAGIELRITEGFIDLTHNEERQKELGIELEYDGWWTMDEI